MQEPTQEQVQTEYVLHNTTAVKPAKKVKKLRTGHGSGVPKGLPARDLALGVCGGLVRTGPKAVELKRAARKAKRG